MAKEKNFALIGAAGFVAPRHMRAIKENGHRLVAALDPFDSVGILDQYFPEAQFFLEFERFDRHLEKLRRQNSTSKVDLVSICSPNYLHDAHCRSALRWGADAICEKPLVINPWNLDALAELENDFGQRIFTILQLRLHPEIQKLKKMVQSAPASKRWMVDLVYVTARGQWYQQSWKGDATKSGGVITNIGIHLFDLLLYIFGDYDQQQLWSLNEKKASGLLTLAKADVRWFLSVDHIDIPQTNPARRSFRALKIDDQLLELSHGFEDLHSESYRQILSGQGFGLAEARPSIELTHKIRQSQAIGTNGQNLWPIEESFVHDPRLYS